MNSSQTPLCPRLPHRVRDAVPPVEVADDVDRLGPRRPDGERDALHLAERPFVAADVGAEDGPETLVAPLVEQVQVQLTERGGEPVRVVLLVLHAVVPGDEQPVVGGRRDLGSGAGPDAVADVAEVHDDPVGQSGTDRLRERPVCGDGQPAGAQVVPQEVVWLAVAALDEGLERPEVSELCGRADGLHEAPFRATASWWTEVWELGSVTSRSTAAVGIPNQLGRLRTS